MITYENRKIMVSKEIDSTAVRIWDIITDTAKWPVWGPSVRTVECEHRYIQKGCTGYVKTILGLRLPFAIMSFQHLSFWNWRVGGIEATGHRLIKNKGDCILIFDMPWWALPYAFICLLALNRIDKLCRLSN